MGLDMFLMSGTGLVGEDCTYKTVANSTRVGYWRKANAIHNFFVKSVQKGVDDCGTYEVSEVHLNDLKERALSVLKDGADPEETLPSVGGFFFGDTSYSDDYFYDLKATLPIVEKALEEIKAGRKVFYSSSW